MINTYISDSHYRNLMKKTALLILILGLMAFCSSCTKNGSPNPAKGIIYNNEKLGLALEFPAEWKDKYIIEESEKSIAVYCQKVSEKYPGIGRLFTIERMIGELISEQDMLQQPVNQQIVLQGNGYTYFTRLPSDVQYPFDDTELRNNYIAMSEQIELVTHSASLLGTQRPKASNEGFKVVGSSFFTVEIPNDWELRALDKPTLSWTLFAPNENVAGVIELIPYNSEGIRENPIGSNMARDYFHDAEARREIQMVLNSEIVNQDTMMKIKNSLAFAAGPFNVIDLQSNAIQYLTRGGKQSFGTIDSIIIENGKPVAVRINLMKLADHDSIIERPGGLNIKDLNKTETYDISHWVSIAPLAAPGFNSHGVYDVFTLDENFLESHKNYKDFYYDFTIGSDGQLKIILGYSAK